MYKLNFKLLSNTTPDDQIINDLLNFYNEINNNLDNYVNQIVPYKNYGRFVLTLIDHELIHEARHFKEHGNGIPVEDIIEGDLDMENTRRYHQNNHPTTGISILYSPNYGSSFYCEFNRDFNVDTNEYVGVFYFSPYQSIDYDTQDNVDDYYRLIEI